MSLTEILSALQKLAPNDKLKAIKFLTTELSNGEKLPTEDLESQAWLEADFIDNLPEYDWGENEIPKGQPVEYRIYIRLRLGDQGKIASCGESTIQILRRLLKL